MALSLLVGSPSCTTRGAAMPGSLTAEMSWRRASSNTGIWWPGSKCRSPMMATANEGALLQAARRAGTWDERGQAHGRPLAAAPRPADPWGKMLTGLRNLSGPQSHRRGWGPWAALPATVPQPPSPCHACRGAAGL